MRPLIALLLAAAPAAFARELPHFDAFLDSTVGKPLTGSMAEGSVTGVEPRLGVPTFFWAAPAPFGARSLRAQGVTVEQAARRYLFAHASLYRAAPAELAESALVRLHDTGQGAIIATFEKRVGGVSVFRDRLHVAMTRDLELVALSGYLSPASLKGSDFKLSAATALSSAWFELLGTSIESFRFREGALDEGGFRRFSATLEQPFSGRAKKVLYGLPDRLVPAWHLELDVGGEISAFVISAEDGAVLSRENLTEADSYSYRVWAQPSGLSLPDDGPQGLTASPHPTGTPGGTFNPPFLAPVLVTLQNSPLSTNDPWLPANATETTGNNVEAYADLVTPDGFSAGDVRATTTTPGNFDRIYDVNLAPDANLAQQQAAITQLFFDVNQLHDWFYDRGFDEAAGNAQTNNFGRGGAGADSIKAEAQDFNGLNNANMTTPADGSQPRMQMFMWTPTDLATLVATPGGSYVNGTAGFGPASFSVTAQVALVNDGVGTVTDGCTALTGLTGRIALIDRGSCTFALKARNALAAGAVGVIIANNNTSTTPPALPGDGTTTNIPALSVTQADGTALKTALGLGVVSVTMSKAGVVNRAGELDNTIVAHEWGHYLSDRLIGDASGLSNNQGRSMGEGWSDFVALLLTVRETDAQVSSNPNWAGVYATAVYALLGPGFLDATYFGIRRYPYSTDFLKNPLTFKHIENGVALPTGPPSQPAGATNAETHNSGEVWAVTLWDCYASLLRATPRLTFDQARDRMMRYLVAGLKLTPSQPTFTEARDGLLAAAAAGDPQDFQLFAAAFARRGMGLRAVSPVRGSNTHAGVVEDFGLGNDLAFAGATLDDEASWCDHDGVLDVGELGRLRVTLRNVGNGTLSATTGTLSTTAAGVTIVNPNLTFGSSLPFGTTTATSNVTLAGLAVPTVIVLTLTFNDPGLMSATAKTATLTFRVQTDGVPTSSATDDAETPILAWTFAKDAALSTVFDWTRRTLTPSQSVFFGRNPGSNADIHLVSPPLTVAATGNLGLVLRHRWDFEAGGGINYDGAVIEVSTSAGSTWTDIGAAAAGYPGTLGGPGSNNPLVGRQAYTAMSPGYPAFITSTLNLGASYAGQTVQVRLRIGSDQASAGAGWDVDSIGFTGIINTPFPALVADRALCINRPPVANAGPDLIVDERSVVALSSAASTDLDTDPLTARWVQLSGPAVTVMNGVFTAPEVTADTTLSLQLIVNDGTVDSAPATLQVTVRQVNRAPVAVAGPAQDVNEGSVATLAGSGSDPDGDALTYAWSQVAGPTVTLSDATSPSPQFTAPLVVADVPLGFELVVSDGTALSVASSVTVTVRNVNGAPVVTVNIPAEAQERSTVTIAATASDPDGDTLSYQWRQTSGPTVTLLTPTASSSSFLAPDVTAATPLTFELTVSDATLMASASGVVSIVDIDGAVNRPPVAVISSGSREVKADEVITLDASGSSDPDGDALAFVWTQSGGDPVALSGGDSAVATITMPKTGARTFTVTVSDPAGASGVAEVTLTVGATAPKGCGCTSGAGLLLPLLVLLGLRRRRS